MSSPLLSVIIVEYSTLSGSGKIQLSKKNRTINERMAIPNRLKKRFTDCLVILIRNFIFHAKTLRFKTKSQRLEPLASLPTLLPCVKLITEAINKIGTATSFHYLTNLYSLKFANRIHFILSFISNSPQSVWIAQTRRSQQETFPLNVPTIAFLFLYEFTHVKKNQSCPGRT